MAYFSSLGRHAGIRLTHHAAAGDVPRPDAHALEAPPEIDEVILAPPVDAADAPRAEEPVAPLGGAGDAAPPRPPSPAAVVPRRRPRPAETRPSQSAVPVPLTAETPEPPEAVSAAEAAVSLPPEPGRTPAAEPAPPLVGLDAPPEAPPVAVVLMPPSPRGSAADEEPPRAFFSRTAELLEAATPAADPAVVQSVVWHDVQEWVSAAPPQPAGVGERPDDTPTPPAALAPLPAPVDRPRLASRDMPRRAPIAAGAPAAAAAIEEQQFELSIGTISVVIESDAPPAPAPVAPFNRVASARPEPRRPRASLRRHYL